MAEVTLALTLCCAASRRSNLSSAHRALLSAQKAFHHASRFLRLYGSTDPEGREIAARTSALGDALQALAPSFQPSIPVIPILKLRSSAA
jgi:hypothetical protein